VTKPAPALSALICAIVFSILPAVAAADQLVWWVADEGEATALREALESLWPGHPVDVRVGEADPAIDGLRADGVDLILVLDGVEERLSPGTEPSVQVTLVRARLRRRAAERAEKPAVETPPEPLQEPVSETQTEPVPRSQTEPAASPEAPEGRREIRRPRAFIAAFVGGGGRVPEFGAEVAGGPPALHLAARLGFEGRFWTVSARGGLRLGDQATVGGLEFDGEAVFLGAGVSLRAVSPPGVSIEGGVAGGVRLITWADRGEPVFKRRGILPAVEVGARGWGPAVRGVSIGGGVRVEIDGRRVVIDSDEGSTMLPPVVFTVEFGVRAGASSTFIEGSGPGRHKAL
jgi:hypothetical protein